jgi:phosphonate transport system permease protein
VIALTFHSTGDLGKLYYEAIEAVDPGVVGAIEANGSNRFEVIWFGILPSCLPLMMSSTLWYWGYNNRAATILCLVGAVGIGYTLFISFSMYEFEQATIPILIMVLLITGINHFCWFFRRRII